MWSLTETEYYLVDKNTKQGNWIKQLHFWNCDLSDVDFTTNDNFKEVKNKRKLSILLGTIDDVKFPVVRVLKLNNGVTVNPRNYTSLYTKEDED
jgi:hypothetical protein